MPTKSAATPHIKYKRVVLKLSGEVLRGKGAEAIDAATLEHICEQVKEIHALGVQVCVVIGGGNIFRGLQGAKQGVDRTTGDYMGMLATVINSLALMDCLEKMGVDTRVQSAIPMNQIAEPFIMRRAIRHLEKKTRRHLRRRHRQSLLHHRHHRGLARVRVARRYHHESDQG